MTVNRARRALRLAALAIATAPSLLAQDGAPRPSQNLGTISCALTAEAPLVRIEGTRERVGDLTLACRNIGGEARLNPRGSLIADLSVTLNASVANAPHGTPVVTVNEGTCVPDASGADDSYPCAMIGGTVSGPLAGSRDPNHSGRVHWRRFAFPIPGAAIPAADRPANPVADCRGLEGMEGGCHPPQTLIRIKNLTVRASDFASGALAGSGRVPIQASVSLSIDGAVHELGQSVVRIATAVPGMAVTVAIPRPERLCGVGEALAEVTVAEGYAGAFEAARQVPDESGSSAGAARLLIRMNGIPEAVSVRAPTAAACHTADNPAPLRLGLVDGASEHGGGGVLAPSQLPDLVVPAGADGIVRVLYEVLEADPLSQQECTIPLNLAAVASADAAVGRTTVSVDASMAPQEPQQGQTGPSDGSRFSAVARASGVTVSLPGCGTTLLFPFVTNQTTFDTALVIVNTSSDPLGTRHQPGRCRLEFYGTGGGEGVSGTILRSIPIRAGQQVSYRLSSGNEREGLQALPGFQGYVVAKCTFQHAQGFAFLTEQIGGASVLAQGYLAQILAGR